MQVAGNPVTAGEVVVISAVVGAPPPLHEIVGTAGDTSYLRLFVVPLDRPHGTNFPPKNRGSPSSSGII